MNEVSFIQLQRWLKLLKAPVSKGFLRKRLFAHPNAESLLSITDTLDELGIENAAVEIDKEKLNQLRTPFLAHLDRQGGRFALIKDVAAMEKYPSFLEEWSGVILVGESNGLPKNEENIRLLSYEREWSALLKVLMISAAAWIIFSVGASFSILNALLVLTSLIGLTASFFIYQKERGVASELLDKLCEAGKSTDCDAVLESKGATPFSWLRFSDVGLIYFFTQLLVLTTAFAIGNAGPAKSFMSPPAALASLFTLYSIYYQLFIVRKWCMLCLIVVGVLILQMALLVPELLLFKISANHMILMSAILPVIGLVSGGWLLLKRLISERKALETSFLRTLRFKYDPGIFIHALEEQRTVDTTPFRNEVQLGNPNAAIQLLVICSPYCKPCSKAHKVIEDLLESDDCNIGVAIRFNVDYARRKDRKAKAVEQILRIVSAPDVASSSEFKRNILNDWFGDMNFDRFTGRYGLRESFPDEDEFHEQREWAEKVHVAFTPTVFINGYELPKQYSIYDLPVLIRGMLLSDHGIKPFLYEKASYNWKSLEQGGTKVDHGRL